MMQSRIAQIYATEGVQAILLRLQDEDGIDVLLTLLGLWQGLAGRALRDWSAVQAASDPWRAEVIEPLRALRRRLKTQALQPNPEPFRARIKQLELQAEWQHLTWLNAMADDLPAAQTSSSDAMRQNLQRLGVLLEAEQDVLIAAANRAN